MVLELNLADRQELTDQNEFISWTSCKERTVSKVGVYLLLLKVFCSYVRCYDGCHDSAAKRVLLELFDSVASQTSLMNFKAFQTQ